MEHSTQSTTSPIMLRISKRVMLIVMGIVCIMAVILVSGMLVSPKPTDGITSISAYLTQCWVGTQSSSSYVFIYEYFGTSTVTPSFTPLVEKLTQQAQVTPAASPWSVVAMAATPTAIGEEGVQADAQRGDIIFHGPANCAACHDTQKGLAGVGPSLLNIVLISGARLPGIQPELYLKESIVSPNTYIVPGFTANVMPQNYKTNLTNLQVNDLIAYLMTLK